MAPLETGWLPETPIDDSILRSFLFNQMEVNRTFAEATGGQVTSSDDVHLAVTTTPIAFLNQALPARPILTTDDPVLDTVEEFFADYPYDATLLSIWPTPDLTTRGWHLWGHPMFCVLGPTESSYEQPADVEVAVAETAGDLQAAERIIIDAFSLAEAAGTPRGSVYRPDLLGTDLEVKLGKLDGEPVATAARYQAYGVVNLTMGATLLKARRRGVWRALVWERVRQAPHLPAVTFTSDDSRPGFVAMGFLPVVRLTMWGRGGRGTTS
jgi:hypothetical protein